MNIFKNHKNEWKSSNCCYRFRQSNSCIAIWDRYIIEAIQNDYGEKTTPSMVHFLKKMNIMLGLDAKNFLNQYPKNIV